jgi:hypothetical protein
LETERRALQALQGGVQVGVGLDTACCTLSRRGASETVAGAGKVGGDGDGQKDEEDNGISYHYLRKTIL